MEANATITVNVMSEVGGNGMTSFAKSEVVNVASTD